MDLSQIPIPYSILSNLKYESIKGIFTIIMVLGRVRGLIHCQNCDNFLQNETQECKDKATFLGILLLLSYLKTTL